MNSPSAPKTSCSRHLNQLKVLLMFFLEKLLKISMMEVIRGILVMFETLGIISFIKAPHKIIHQIKIR
jgi:hypothetical protein